MLGVVLVQHSVLLLDESRKVEHKTNAYNSFDKNVSGEHKQRIIIIPGYQLIFRSFANQLTLLIIPLIAIALIFHVLQSANVNPLTQIKIPY